MSSIGETNEYLTFILAGEEYAIEVSKIESVLEYTKITPLPGTDETIKGVINLRGRALPVVDLRMILNLDESEISLNTSIVVMFIDSEGEVLTLGGLVDSVKEVIEIMPDQIQEAPKVGIRIKNSFIVGMAKKEENFIIILDIDKILNADQMALAADAENLSIEMVEGEAAEEVETTD